jgi:hypothetical protein
MSIAAAFAADKDAPFKAKPASSYPHQTNAQVTIGVDPFRTEEKIKTAFGKLRLNEYGVLPVLVVIQNDSNQSIRLDRMKVEYIGMGRNRVEATPARDIRYLNGPNRPTLIPGPAGPVPIRGKKNPLDAWEIEGRAFAAQMLPAGQTASGFIYFQTTQRGPATVLVSDLTEAASGKELLYFEIPVQ